MWSYIGLQLYKEIIQIKTFLSCHFSKELRLAYMELGVIRVRIQHVSFVMHTTTS